MSMTLIHRATLVFTCPRGATDYHDNVCRYYPRLRPYLGKCALVNVIVKHHPGLLRINLFRVVCDQVGGSLKHVARKIEVVDVLIIHSPE